jgi:hypothetical protein
LRVLCYRPRTRISRLSHASRRFTIGSVFPSADEMSLRLYRDELTKKTSFWNQRPKPGVSQQDVDHLKSLVALYTKRVTAEGAERERARIAAKQRAERSYIADEGVRAEALASDAMLRAAIMKELNEDPYYVTSVIADGVLHGVALSPEREEWLYGIEADWEAIHENDEEWLDPEEFKAEDPEGYRRWMEGPDQEMPLRRSGPGVN